MSKFLGLSKILRIIKKHREHCLSSSTKECSENGTGSGWGGVALTAFGEGV